MNKTQESFRGTGRRLLVGLTLLVLLCASAFAQETTGSLQGTVTDPSGATVPNAKISVTGANLPKAITLTTDATGNYILSQVPVGMHTIEATAAGFRSTKKTDVPVVLGRATRVDFKLEVGQVSESVVVSADAVMVDTTSSSSAVNVDKSFFDLIPKGRSFYDLVAIAPGARNETKTGGIQVDGASGSENTYYLDGMEVTNLQTGVLNNQNRVPVEMVSQLQVKNGVMEAQYGGAMGGVVNAVVRSGSNELHGEVGFYFNNNSMEARDRPTLRQSPWDENTAEYFQNPKDTFTKWNPIFSLGGPILKNKLFFFAGYMPTFNNIDRTVNFNNTEPAYTYTTKGPYHRQEVQNYTVGKLDYLPFNKLRVNSSWVWNPTYNRGVLPVKGGTDAIENTWAEQGDYTSGNILSGQIDYLATSKFVISFRGGYSYNNTTNNYGIPSNTAIYYSGASTTVPPPDLRGPTNTWIQQPVGFTRFDTYTRKNYNADATYIANWHGQHSIKGGWQMNKLANSVAKSSYANGYYRYYWGSKWTCITSQCEGQQTGAYGYYRYRVLGTYGDASSDNQGIFLQDNWRVNKYLSLNLGIRTEREFLPSFKTATTEAAPPIEFSWSQKWSPRLGFAWDPHGDGKQRIYGSFGYFYDVMKYEMPRGSFGGDIWLEWYYSLDDPNVVRSNSGPPADPMKLPGKFYEMVNWRIPSNDPTSGLMDKNLRPMKQQMFDLGYDYSISPSLVASLRYTNRRLITTIEDTGYIGDEGETYLIANPGYGIVADPKNWLKWMGPGIPTTPKAIRDYDALEIRLDKRFSKNYNFAASYTLSRSWGNYSGLASSDENGRNSPNVNRYFDQPWVGINQLGELANGRLATDRPHSFKFFGSYSYHNKLGVTTLSPNVVLFSGTPLTTEANVISSTPAFPYGRGDLGRSPFYSGWDLNVMHDFVPVKSHESIKVRFEFSVFNLFNQGTVTDEFKTLIHSSDNWVDFNDYADVFKGFNMKSLMKEQGRRVDPQYGLASAWQQQRTMRLQLSFHF